MMKKAAKKKPTKKAKATRNPSGYGDRSDIEKRTFEKARSWYGKDELTTEPKVLRGYVAPEAAIEVGTITAIEYDSNKFDGQGRTYRHDVTKKRKLFISLDGSTLIVWPPFKITKRGIEG